MQSSKGRSHITAVLINVKQLLAAVSCSIMYANLVPAAKKQAMFAMSLLTTTFATTQAVCKAS